MFGQEVTVDWSIISDRKELDLYGSHLGPYCYPFTIDDRHGGIVEEGASSPRACRSPISRRAST